MKACEMKGQFVKRWGERDGGFICRCVRNSTLDCPQQEKTLLELWEKASNLPAFLGLLSQQSIDFKVSSQAYGEIARREGWGVARTADVRRVVTMSDAGSVLVVSADGQLRVSVPNGYGDGDTEVLVAEGANQINISSLDYQMALEGRFEVYDYDCASESGPFRGDVVLSLDGPYTVYSANGTVAFVRFGR